MSGLRTGRMVPVEIVITPQSFKPGHPGGVKKTSTVTVGRGLDPDLKLGLLIEQGQTIHELTFTDAGKSPIQCHDVTTDPRWSGASAALHRFMNPGEDRQWRLFAIPNVTSGFQSDLVLSRPPRPPAYQNVPIVAIHVKEGDSEKTVYTNILRGAFGYGVSIVRADDNEWAALGPKGASS